MRRRNFLASLGAMSGSRLAFAQVQPAFRAGFAETDITPEIGMEQPGGYGKVFHKSFHDSCKVRASVFSDGNKAVALVGLDALVVPRDTVLAARKRIEAACGLPGAHILIAASHSHSSGPVGMVQPGEYDFADEFVRKLAYEHSSAANPKYLKLVEDQIVTAVTKAHSLLAPVRASAGVGREDQVAFNRRFRMKNGLTYTHPGQGNPDIIKPAGPSDPEVGVVAAWTDSGTLAGCIVNFACHATTSPGGISANWIYDTERTIRGVFGQQAIVVFLPGTCGDITQVDNMSPYARPTGEQWSRLVGGRVGAEAVKVLYSAHPGRLAPVDARFSVFRIARRAPSAETVAARRRIAAMNPKDAGLTEWLFAKETVMADALIRHAPSVELEVQAIQLGPVGFLSSPAEYFVEFGLDIKKRSPFPLTFPVELANGYVGYVPTEEALSSTGGGYETRLTSYSNLEPSAGRRIADACVELAWKMKPGEVPLPSSAPPFDGPWTYGNLPAELRE